MVDILLNTDGDLLIRNGDLVVGNSDDQNVSDILQSQKGDYKRSPQIGLNAINFLSSTQNGQDIKTQVKLQLQLDGFTVQDVKITTVDKQLQIEPTVTRDI